MDGRIQIFNLQKSNTAGKLNPQELILFQAHKVKVKGYGAKNELFQVNGMGFHKSDNNFFYSIGSNGELIFWDTQKRNKRKSYNFKDQCLSAADLA